MSMARFCLIALVLTSAAVAVSAVEEEHPDDMDIDRTHFEDPALKEDPVATGPHSEIEAAWILPDSQDGKLPVGRTNDLLVALANSGSTMFNVTHIEAELMDADGKQILLTFGKYDYGQSLGPREQRSFRFPMPLDKEQALGDYTLVARAYYMSRTKDPFVSVVVNDIAELVPPLPTGEFAKMLQVGLGGLAMLSLVVVTGKSVLGGSKGGSSAKKAAKKAASASAPSGESNEWLSGTLRAGTENKSPKKAKKRA